MDFILNKTLNQDSYFIRNLELCQLRLINNKNFPWVILVPQINDLVEITDLKEKEYQVFNKEVKLVANLLKKEFLPDKLNIATIGNVVPQLHMHIIARYKNDKLFPKPVWGDEFKKYTQLEAEKIIKRLRLNL